MHFLSLFLSVFGYFEAVVDHNSSPLTMTDHASRLTGQIDLQSRGKFLVIPFWSVRSVPSSIYKVVVAMWAVQRLHFTMMVLRIVSVGFPEYL